MPLCHPALLVGEILLQIFSNLSKESLPPVALTCRAWSILVLDVLWRDADFINILKVLSPMIEENGKMDWERFHLLAPRIRILRHYKSLDTTLITELYLTNPNPKPLPLLPNIVELYWYDLPDLSLTVFGDTVVKVNLTLQSGGDTHPRFFSRAAALAPNITELEVWDDDALSQLTLEGLAVLLRALRNLRTIAIYASEVEDVRPLITALSELPVLEEVEIMHPGERLDAWTPSGEVTFPSLSELRLTGDGVMTGVPALLRSIAAHSSQLTRFTLGDVDQGCMSEVGGVLESLGEHQGLRSVIINADKDPSMLSFQMLEPIGACSGLESLKIYLIGPIQVTNEELQRMLSGLPKLKALALNGEGPTPPILTIQVLPIITTACPSIKDINLSGVDASKDVSPPQHPFKASSTLASLFVGVSPMQDAQAVALFLERLSSGEALKVSTAWDAPNEQKVLWGAVAEWMPALRQAREYGRAEARASAARV